MLNRVTKISAGRDFALALRSDGIVAAGTLASYAVHTVLVLAGQSS